MGGKMKARSFKKVPTTEAQARVALVLPLGGAKMVPKVIKFVPMGGKDPPNSTNWGGKTRARSFKMVPTTEAQARVTLVLPLCDAKMVPKVIKFTVKNKKTPK